MHKKITSLIIGLGLVLSTAIHAQTARFERYRTNDANNPNYISVDIGAMVPEAFATSASKTRPNDTTAYAAGDVIAQSDSAGTVWGLTAAGPEGGAALVTGVSLRVDISSVPSGMIGFRLHLYSSAPTAINDNAAYNLPSGDRAKYLGYIDIPPLQDLGDTIYAQDDGVRKQLKFGSGSTTLYGILETRGAFTPTAQAVYTVGLGLLKVSEE